jgi:hypothetical protein
MWYTVYEKDSEGRLDYMKKLCLMIVALAAVLSFTACKQTADTEQQTTNPEQQTESIADLISVECIVPNHQSSVQLADGEKAYIDSLLKNGKWGEGLIKMTGNYTITLANGVTFSYASDIGAINDVTHNRYLVFTDEQQRSFNALLKGVSSLVASVEIGMTYAEVVAVLGESGPDIGSGLCLYEWTLPDGSVWIGAFKPQGKGNIPPEDWVLFNFDLVEYH